MNFVHETDQNHNHYSLKISLVHVQKQPEDPIKRESDSVSFTNNRRLP